MTFLQIIAAFVVWYMFGVWSFIHMITEEDDIRKEDLGMVSFAGLLGPIILAIGWYYSYVKDGKAVIFPKRES